MLARKMIVGMVAVIVVLMSGAAFGTTYYVAADGNDDANGLRWDTAFATIGKGITTASGGDAVEVNEGTYYETVDFGGKAITVRSVDANDWDVVAATIIDANSESADGVTFDSGEDANSVLRGFTVRNGSAGVYCDSADPVITRCIIKDNGSDGVYCSGSSATITNNKISGNDGYGIYCSGGSPTVKNNWIYENGSAGFRASGSSPTVMNNTVGGNTSKGIWCTTQSNPTISNCIVWGNGDDLVSCSATYSCIEDGDSGTGNISSDPCFVDEASDDYHLDPNSPVIEMGDPDYEPDAGETDIDNGRRVEGVYVDMGSVENDADKWYVKEGSTFDDELEPSWSNAFGELYDALDNASLSAGDEIWVAAGTYAPDPESRGNSLTIDEAIAVFGGFPPSGEPTMDDRDAAVYETILSGDRGTCGDVSDNSYHVVEFASGSDGAVLDGFTITGGNADGSSLDDYGGGIYCYDVSPTIEDCLIKGNRAETGAGMYNYSGSPTLVNCVFSGNCGNQYAGGMFNYDGASPVLTNCVFVRNSVLLYGGGGSR